MHTSQRKSVNGEIFETFHVQIFLFFVKMDKIRKGSDLRKEKWGSSSIQEGKIAAKFSKRLSIRTVTSFRDISEKTWVHSYPMMPQATLCPSEDQTLARCHQS